MRRTGFAAAFDRIASWFRAQTRARRDLLVIVALTLPLCWFVVVTDAFDRASLWVHRHAFWELEELLVLLFCLGLAAAVYAFRRVGDLSQEIAQRRAAEEEAHRLARYDVLIGLANRRRFLEEFDDLTRNLPKGCGCALMVMDLDNFKPINDVYGHRLGDEVLRVVAKRLLRLVEGVRRHHALPPR